MSAAPSNRDCSIPVDLPVFEMQKGGSLLWFHVKQSTENDWPS
jgi:hypothetical protein